MKTKSIAEITEDEARQWLIANDPEGATIWKDPVIKCGLIDAVYDNLCNFGDEEQSGDLRIVFPEFKMFVEE